jgi:hypothetical protein
MSTRCKACKNRLNGFQTPVELKNNLNTVSCVAFATDKQMANSAEFYQFNA